MDLLEGLKYGAIGLCVILFIISTRLVSKEQFIKLDVLQMPDNSIEAIRTRWKTNKKHWANKDYKYIYYSDVPQLVRQYLEKFYPST